MHTDPIADMLTRIRNAQAVKKPEVVLPYSKIKLNILELMSKNGWLGKVELQHPNKTPSKTIKKAKSDLNSRFQMIRVELKYSERKPNINSLKRISKPGRRIYVKKDNIPVVLDGLGMAVISTPKGILTDKQAKEQKVGGEVVCEIY